ncbi:DinB family protein [Oerskovia sp. M15]
MVLHRYLQAARDALVWKLEGLDERAARWPWTPTGTNLLGLVKHAAGVEMGYFGETFGRDWPTPDEVPWMAESAEDNADMWATVEESTASVVDLYRRVWAFSDATIDALDLDARGRVAWWPAERDEVTLLQVIVHVTNDLARHAATPTSCASSPTGAQGSRRRRQPAAAVDVRLERSRRTAHGCRGRGSAAGGRAASRLTGRGRKGPTAPRPPDVGSRQSLAGPGTPSTRGYRPSGARGPSGPRP